MSAIRRATADDVPPLGALLASAFAEDPFTRWMLGPHRTSLELLYRTLVSLNLPHRHVFTNAAANGVAVWRPAERSKMAAGEELSMLGAVLRTIGLPRFLRLLPQFLAIERRHPKGPYAQLVVLGVTPSAQGRGVAGGLLRSALADCDTHGTPTFLETSNPRNLPLYERHGFRVTDVLAVPKGPNVWFMWRAAARANCAAASSDGPNGWGQLHPNAESTAPSA